ncbi:penicillin-binding protein 2 [Dermacoccaceae bacterium W4C1]
MPRLRSPRAARPWGHASGRPRRVARLGVLMVVAVALILGMVGRLAQLQISQGDELARQAGELNTRTTLTPAQRGRILADDGTALVAGTTAPVLTVDPAVLSRSGDGGLTLMRRVAAVIGGDPKALLERTKACGTAGAPSPPVCFDGSAHEPIPIASGVSGQRVLTLLERPEDFPGLAVSTMSDRAYPQLSKLDLAQVLGYLGRTNAQEVEGDSDLTSRDMVGRAGLERQYDSVLRGTPGRSTVAVDAQGLADRQVNSTAATPGRDVITHLDPAIQARAQQALHTAISTSRKDGNPTTSGAVVVLDASDGGVAAMVSAPSYDPRVWSGGITSSEYRALTASSTASPLLNRSTAFATAPASTFKAFSLPAAIASGADPDGTYDCSSSVRIGNRSFRNFESVAYGPIGMEKALEVSCDTVFYRWAYDAWVKAGGSQAGVDAADPFAASARSFGLGRATGVDLPGEASGRIPDRQWKQQYWKATRADACARVKGGYPGQSKERAAYLKQLDEENCTSGGTYRAGDAVNFAIGQGDVSATPLQIATGYAAVANGGTLWAPRLAAATRDPDGSDLRAVPAQRTGTVTLPAATRQVLTAGLADVTRQGTAAAAFRGFDLSSYPVSGKTGTAEVYGKEATSWFASYGPKTASGKQYVVVVMVPESGSGATYAAPAARSIWDLLRTRG